MNTLYEMTVIFDADLDDAGIEEQIAKITTTVENHSGAVIKTDNWGRRPLSYLMDKKTHGIYVLLTLSGDNTLVADIRRQLKINDLVRRVLIVKKDKFAPDLQADPREEASAPSRREGGFGGDRDHSSR
jgi:small subunit ribosomal protein S6